MTIKSWQGLYEEEVPQRVIRWLAQGGVCSRRAAEGLIDQGLVVLNGHIITAPGQKIQKGDRLEVTIAGSEVKPSFSLILHKPTGLVSAQPESGEVPAARLLTRDRLVTNAPQVLIPDRQESLAPLGRLDKDSRGLLLLSNDGVLAKAIIGPQSQIDKDYQVTVSGRINTEKLKLLRHGLSLDGRPLKPAKVVYLQDQCLGFVLKEGRKHQIRRMCEQVGLHVTDLFRTRIGPLVLGDLKEGFWRHMQDEERAALIEASLKKPEDESHGSSVA